MSPDKEPLLSVIVPAHNVARYITQCVDSIVSQSYPNLEIIVVDDGSKDETGEILRDLDKQHRELKVIHLPTNVGVYNARVTGLRASRGSLIGFVDGDDYIAADMYSRLVKSLTYTQSDISICGSMKVSEGGNAIGHKVWFSEPKTFETHLLDHFCRLHFGSGILWNKVFRKEVIRPAFANGIDPASLAFSNGAEDYIVNLFAFDRARRVRTISEVPYYYRMRQNSASHSGSQAAAFSQILRAYVVALEAFADAGDAAQRSIDHLYSQLLRFECYTVPGDMSFDDVREDISQSLVRLAAVRPEAVHSLIHLRAEQAHESKRGLMARLRNVRRKLSRYVSHASL